MDRLCPTPDEHSEQCTLDSEMWTCLYFGIMLFMLLYTILVHFAQCYKNRISPWHHLDWRSPQTDQILLEAANQHAMHLAQILKSTQDHATAAAKAAQAAADHSFDFPGCVMARESAYRALVHANQCTRAFVGMVGVEKGAVERAEERKVGGEGGVMVDADEARREVEEMKELEMRVIGERMLAVGFRDACFRVTMKEVGGEGQGVGR